ncbi:MAG: HupE/UreJ family protein [Porticoccaceae bacterium]|nr:HupE/UreJ family protein [Porticoccaceae bacterium]
MTRSKATATSFILYLMLLSLDSSAHNRSQSFSAWTFDGQQVDMVFTVKAREATRLMAVAQLPAETALLRHLQSNIYIQANSLPCPLYGKGKILPATSGYLRANLKFICEPILGNVKHDIRLDSFFDSVPSHIHYARIAINPHTSIEYLYTDAQRSHQLNQRQLLSTNSLSRTVGQYTSLGVAHIFGGIDHIAFLLALLLLLRGLRDIVWMVTGFTLGHSITLSLSVLGVVTPNIAAVEAIIGFTIALVAAENIGAKVSANHQIAMVFVAGLFAMLLTAMIWDIGLAALSCAGLIIFTLAYLPHSKDRQNAIAMRPVLSLIFGLIHGFGFAQVLTEIGLPSNQLWPALFGFNLGVELGQLIIVALAWLAVNWLPKFIRAKKSAVVLDIASALLCSLGLYWFIARSYGVA